MPYFPQLRSGATAQYPLVKRSRTRTVVNELPEGVTWRIGDPDSSIIRWELHFNGLSDEELSDLEGFHTACQGRLLAFTFLDPTANLLTSSEDLSNEAWAVDPLMVVVANGTDPWGGSSAQRLTNSGQSIQGVRQSLGVPAAYQYCFSFYARSDSAVTVRAFHDAEGASITQDALLTSNWRRVICSGAIGGAAEVVSFGIDAPLGAQFDIAGPQVEAQPGASRYKRTVGEGGIHDNARFADDIFEVRTDAPDAHSTVVRIQGQYGV